MKYQVIGYLIKMGQMARVKEIHTVIDGCIIIIIYRELILTNEQSEENRWPYIFSSFSVKLK